MRKFLTSMAMALAVTFAAPAAAAAVVAGINPAFDYDLSTPETYTEPEADPLPPATLGYSFTLDVPTTVNALGYWSDGNLVSEQVGIWDSFGNLISSTFVTRQNEVGGYFYSFLTTPVSLAIGNYVIGGSISEGGMFPVNMTGVVNRAPGYTYGADRQFSDGFGFPAASAGGGYGAQGIALVNFSIAAVPEPATWALMLLGFGVVGTSIRRRRKVLATA